MKSIANRGSVQKLMASPCADSRWINHDEIMHISWIVKYTIPVNTFVVPCLITEEIVRNGEQRTGAFRFTDINDSFTKYDVDDSVFDFFPNFI